MSPSRPDPRRAPVLRASTPPVHPPPLSAAEAVDAELLAQATQRINRLYAQRSLATRLAIAELLVELFWEGDLGSALDGLDRHATFRALRTQPGLFVGYAELCRILRVAQLVDVHGRSRCERLTFSHLVELLPLHRAIRQQSELLETATTRQWTVRQLRAAVKARLGTTAAPLRPLVGATRTVRRTTAALARTLDRLDDLGPSTAARAQLPALVAELDGLIEAAERLRGAALEQEAPRLRPQPTPVAPDPAA